MNKKDRRLLHFIFIVIVIVLLIEKCEGPSIPFSLPPAEDSKTNPALNKKNSNKKRRGSFFISKPEGPPTVYSSEIPEIPSEIILLQIVVIVESVGAYEFNVLLDEGNHNNIKIDWTELKSKISKVSTPKAISKLEADTIKDESNGFTWIAVSTLNALGFPTSYNESRQEIFIRIPPEDKNTKVLEIIEEKRKSNKKGDPPSPISGFINFSGSKTFYNGENNANRNSSDPLSVSVDAALNVHGWVLETDGSWAEGSPYKRNSIRIVKDDTINAVRYKFGDVATPRGGFLTSIPLAGISITKEPGIHPGRLIYPINEHEIMVKTRAQLNVIINDRVVYSKDLDSGTYDIRNFPFSAGLNDVRLVLKHPFTKKILDEYILTSFSYSTNILRKGNHEFSYTAGNKLKPNGSLKTIEFLDKNYSKDESMFSLTHKYGLLDRLTTALYAQIESAHKLFGLGFSIASPFGVFNIESAFSSSDLYKSQGFGSKIEYLFRIKNLNFKLGHEKIFDGFSRLGEDPNNKEAINKTYFGSVGFPLTDTTSLHLFGSKLIKKNEKEKLETQIGLSSRLRQGMNLSAIGRLVKETDATDPEASFQLNLNWNFGAGRATARTDTKTKTDSVSVGFLKDLGDSMSIGTGAAVARTVGSNNYSVGTQFNSLKGTIGAAHAINQTAYGFGGTSSLNANTALAFVGTEVAWTGPVADSFVIVKGYDALENEEILVNPSSDYEKAMARTDLFGDAVARITSYQTNRVIVGLADQKPGISIKKDNFYLSPTYKSGTLIEVRTEQLVTIKGLLLGDDENPLYEVSGELRPINSEKNEEPIFFFTGRDGTFEIEGLKRKKYILEFFDGENVTIELNIPEDSNLNLELGKVYAPLNKPKRK